MNKLDLIKEIISILIYKEKLIKKQNKYIIKMLPTLSEEELKEILNDEEIDLYFIEEELEGNNER